MKNFFKSLVIFVLIFNDDTCKNTQLVTVKNVVIKFIVFIENIGSLPP